MKFWDIEQNTDDWYMARAGIPTASAFSRIITLSGKPSTQAQDYAYECVAEIYMGRPITQEFDTFAMQWGKDNEESAIKTYELLTDTEIKSGGFFTDDQITYGASPDVRIYEGKNLVGAAEIKCPQHARHIKNVFMQDDGKIDKKYFQQVQGQMLTANLEWVDWFSYHPDLPPSLVRTYRDEKFINLLKEQLHEFNYLIENGIQILKNRGFEIEKPIKSMELLSKNKIMDLSASTHIQSPVQLCKSRKENL